MAKKCDSQTWLVNPNRFASKRVTVTQDCLQSRLLANLVTFTSRICCRFFDFSKLYGTSFLSANLTM